MGYSYAPQSGDVRARAFFNKRGKHLAVAAAIILFVGTFHFVGNTLTGYVTYSKSLEQELNETHNELLDARAQNEICDVALESANSGIASLNVSLNSCSTDLFSEKLSLSACNKEREKLENATKNLNNQLSSCNSDKLTSLEAYKQLARSSVKAICCSFGDVQSGTVRSWNITNNSIVCSGSYTINCTSGESDY